MKDYLKKTFDIIYIKENATVPCYEKNNSSEHTKYEMIILTILENLTVNLIDLDGQRGETIKLLQNNKQIADVIVKKKNEIGLFFINLIPDNEIDNYFWEEDEFIIDSIKDKDAYFITIALLEKGAPIDYNLVKEALKYGNFKVLDYLFDVLKPRLEERYLKTLYEEDRAALAKILEQLDLEHEVGKDHNKKSYLYKMLFESKTHSVDYLLKKGADLSHRPKEIRSANYAIIQGTTYQFYSDPPRRLNNIISALNLIVRKYDQDSDLTLFPPSYINSNKNLLVFLYEYYQRWCNIKGQEKNEKLSAKISQVEKYCWTNRKTFSFWNNPELSDAETKKALSKESMSANIEPSDEVIADKTALGNFLKQRFR